MYHELNIPSDCVITISKGCQPTHSAGCCHALEEIVRAGLTQANSPGGGGVMGTPLYPAILRARDRLRDLCGVDVPTDYGKGDEENAI